MKISTKNGKLATIMCAVLFMLAVFVVGKFMGYGATREFFIEGQDDGDDGDDDAMDAFATEAMPGGDGGGEEEEDEDAEQDEADGEADGTEGETEEGGGDDEYADPAGEGFKCGSGAPPVPPPNGDKKESTPVGIVDETMGFPIS